MFDFDTGTMSRCLKVPSEKFRDKLKTTLDDYMTTMAKELEEVPDRATLREVFLGHVADVLGVAPETSELGQAELAAISRAEEQLSDPEWTYMQGRRFVEMGVKIASGTHLTESAFKAPGGLIRIHLLARDNKIEDLMIAGDFTCLPAPGVDDMAGLLKGSDLDAASLEAGVTRIMDNLGMEMPGVKPRDIATAIMMAHEPAE